VSKESLGNFMMALFLSGCVTAPPSTTGSLGFEDSRRVVIVGENVNPHIAGYYQKKYDALVWFTPYQGKFVNKATNFLQNGFGSSVALKSLINELKSINHTVGKWEIIVPGIAENYFLVALKKMEDHSLSKARGIVVLIDSKNNKEMEDQLWRVTDGNFFVSYEFHKD
jgi:hypothetical protein